MEKNNLTSFFEEFLHNKSLFVNRSALLSSYTPESIPHRDKEMNHIASILAPALKQEKPSNLFIYGNTGTGKTLVVKHVVKNMGEISKNKKIPLKVIYVNCKLKRVADTEYRLMSQLASCFGKAIPSTGLPTDEVYKSFYSAAEKEQGIILLVLDEVDQLIKKVGDNVLYNLTRINEELKGAQISILGISNDTTLTENMDIRVKSSLSEEDVFFTLYNAVEMKSILQERASKAFHENAIEQGVIEKCAAYAAREHGDARKAIELLRVAGELAERSKNEKVSFEHIDEAEEKLEREKIFDIIKTQPKQFQAVLYSIITLKNKNSIVYTGEIYDLYKKICFKIGLRPLTQRRVSDIIGEFELIGIINTKTISKGRYGRTREITMSIPSSTNPLTKKILEEELSIA
ncbi:MAG: orc1/cdc6 family replication initiation protein [Candidatus Woesearchaeota archaeon]|jgi:cell division control protein 6|nr:orc1/cdc6 family replication initiation protein [Candidatus Woesearchaeota archaeon]MDP7622964.1 orc1/cdc6 family replication initiation protein [Candidatus Woesearchaeota archaeon]HJN56405.1 orc1/cdc6 family replication initiation protein [Candidatus Woesearchaeota archaeon]|tara:strand:+ start:3844 stop:5052 length:1209 start_codon:yes stop_codon:yes gene_type:complete